MLYRSASFGLGTAQPSSSPTRNSVQVAEKKWQDRKRKKNESRSALEGEEERREAIFVQKKRELMKKRVSEMKEVEGFEKRVK